MKHPLAWIPGSNRRAAFLPLLAGAFILFALFQPLGAPLVNSAAPAGIVSFELAGTAENAARMVNSWDANARLYAAFGLGFDYLFMPVYALALALGTLLAAGRHPGGFARLAAWTGWGALLAAGLDAVENIGLWNSLLGNMHSAWPAVSFWCAGFKFGLLFLGILVGLVGWLWPKKVH